VGKVRVGWGAVESATGYDVWRGTRNLLSMAARWGRGGRERDDFDDTGVSGSTVYYYWVRAKNASAVGGLGGGVSGYAASRTADLYAEQFVVLPGVLGWVVIRRWCRWWWGTMGRAGWVVEHGGAGGVLGDDQCGLGGGGWIDLRVQTGI
jgi:hypothetical protein